VARTLICTVGTSLLSNRDGRPWGGWKDGQPLPEAAAVDDWLAQADPALASAETNTLRGLGLREDDHVLLLHSDTPVGEYCSGRLRTWLQSRCRDVSERRLEALGYHGASFAQRGLRRLTDEAATAVRRARAAGREPLFCATGGFKAETAFLNLLGALLQVEVCYIHEQFRNREVVRFPRLPLVWDADFVARHQAFFEWIDAQPRQATEVENRLRAAPELRPLVDEDEDGNTYLNAAGNLLYQAARTRLERGAAAWPEASPRAPEEKNALSGVEHHRPPGWEGFVRRLCAIGWVHHVRYDEAAWGGPVVKPLDADVGELGVRYERGGKGLPLRVATTARGETQTQLVAESLRKLLR
jgi:putative CRISPR-associated protein (TIGR02619 family)